MKDTSELRELIAKSIKSADSSYFWEDYMKQADSVIKALNNRGLTIVPLEPTLPMLQSGVHSVVIGKTKPQELASQIYKGMVKAYMK